MVTDAQVNVPGPLQQDGSGLRPPVIARLVAGLPSLLLNVTVTGWLPPTTTLTVPLGEGVPITVLSTVAK